MTHKRIVESAIRLDQGRLQRKRDYCATARTTLDAHRTARRFGRAPRDIETETGRLPGAGTADGSIDGGAGGGATANPSANPTDDDHGKDNGGTGGGGNDDSPGHH